MQYPDLKQDKLLAIDIETYDPGLNEDGPGVFRRDGYILGVGISNGAGFSEYYNLGHDGYLNTEEKRKNLQFIKETLAFKNNKLGSRLLYDLDWLENWGEIPVNGKLYDIEIAEPLIDENRKLLNIAKPYSLDALSTKYLKRGKRWNKAKAFCKEHGLKGDIRLWLWKMPYDIAREYVIGDVEDPIDIFKIQWDILKNEQLTYIFEIEIGLLRLLLKMRKVGVPVDQKAINEGISILSSEIKTNSEILFNQYGKFNINSPKQIAKIFDNLRITYPRHQPTNNMMMKGIYEGNPHLDKNVLEVISREHKIAELILNIRKAYKTLNTFFINSFHQHNINGRIHCEFFPVSTDENGTKSGRFSSANPNLQNIPSNPDHKTLCRKVFVSEEDCLWGQRDYSQIEYRFIAHYAVGSKSDEIRRRYNEDPKTDYHGLVMEWTGLPRKPTKQLNFGAAYFMGVSTCAKKFGWTEQQSRELLEMYHRELPFVKATRNKVVRIAKQRGYIRTILNRRARVTDYMRMMGKEYSMFNRLIQGGAADLLKKAMLDAYKAGIFDVLIPHLTVHDELDVSIPRNKEGFDAFDELGNVMENAIKLKVPIFADAKIGNNWGELEDYDRTKYV